MSSRRRYNIVKANIKQFSNPRRHSKHRRQHVSFRMDTVKPIGLGGGNGGSNSMTAPPPPPLPNKQSSTADDKIPADHDPISVAAQVLTHLLAGSCTVSEEQIWDLLDAITQGNIVDFDHLINTVALHPLIVQCHNYDPKEGKIVTGKGTQHERKKSVEGVVVSSSRTILRDLSILNRINNFGFRCPLLKKILNFNSGLDCIKLFLPFYYADGREKEDWIEWQKDSYVQLTTYNGVINAELTFKMCKFMMKHWTKVLAKVNKKYKKVQSNKKGNDEDSTEGDDSDSEGDESKPNKPNEQETTTPTKEQQRMHQQFMQFQQFMKDNGNGGKGITGNDTKQKHQKRDRDGEGSGNEADMKKQKMQKMMAVALAEQKAKNDKKLAALEMKHQMDMLKANQKAQKDQYELQIKQMQQQMQKQMQIQDTQSKHNRPTTPPTRIRYMGHIKQGPPPLPQRQRQRKSASAKGRGRKAKDKEGNNPPSGGYNSPSSSTGLFTKQGYRSRMERNDINSQRRLHLLYRQRAKKAKDTKLMDRRVTESALLQRKKPMDLTSNGDEDNEEGSGQDKQSEQDDSENEALSQIAAHLKAQKQHRPKVHFKDKEQKAAKKMNAMGEKDPADAMIEEGEVKEDDEEDGEVEENAKKGASTGSTRTDEEAEETTKESASDEEEDAHEENGEQPMNALIRSKFGRFACHPKMINWINDGKKHCSTKHFDIDFTIRHMYEVAKNDLLLVLLQVKTEQRCTDTKAIEKAIHFMRKFVIAIAKKRKKDEIKAHFVKINNDIVFDYMVQIMALAVTGRGFDSFSSHGQLYKMIAFYIRSLEHHKMDEAVMRTEAYLKKDNLRLEAKEAKEAKPSDQ